MADNNRSLNPVMRAIFGPEPVTTKTGYLLCVGCRERGSCQFGIISNEILEGGKVRTLLRCPANFAGGPKVAHGGWVSAVLDEMLGHLSLYENKFSVTSSLTVDYHRPVPVEHDLEGHAWVEKRDGERWHVVGEVYLLGTNTLLARAKGLFIERDISHFERLKEWLKNQDKA